MLATASLAALPERERRGSRARCLLLTGGSDEAVARRLSALAAPFATVDPARHAWLPRGIAFPREAKLGEEAALLPAATREGLMDWWLAVRAGANTPNWDIASTCTIGGREGLLLVEAKARAGEFRAGGKPKGRAENGARIAAAIAEADDGLNRIMPGWALSSASCYQLCNRFAWGWKLAGLGVPVVLIYLGFLRADEMADCGRPLAGTQDWQALVAAHCRGRVPEAVWTQPLLVSGTLFHAAIRSVELPLA